MKIFGLRVSKRMALILLSLALSAGLTIYAIDMAARNPASASSIAAIAGTCIASMIAGAWSYITGETQRPSYSPQPPFYTGAGGHPPPHSAGDPGDV